MRLNQYLQKIGKRVKELRKVNGKMTQLSLGVEIKADERTVQRIEAGKPTSLVKLNRIAELFKLDVEMLMHPDEREYRKFFRSYCPCFKNNSTVSARSSRAAQRTAYKI